MTGQWRIIAAAMITAAALALATALAFGPHIWAAYLDVAWRARRLNPTFCATIASTYR